MRTIKNLALLFVAAIFAMGVNAQSSSTAKPAQTTAPAAAKGSTGSKTAAAPTNVKAADPVDPKLKGPKGETVYTGAKGGKYYLNASGNKTYLKPAAK